MATKPMKTSEFERPPEGAEGVGVACQTSSRLHGGRSSHQHRHQHHHIQQHHQYNQSHNHNHKNSHLQAAARHPLPGSVSPMGATSGATSGLSCSSLPPPYTASVDQPQLQQQQVIRPTDSGVWMAPRGPNQASSPPSSAQQVTQVSANPTPTPISIPISIPTANTAINSSQTSNQTHQAAFSFLSGRLPADSQATGDPCHQQMFSNAAPNHHQAGSIQLPASSFPVSSPTPLVASSFPALTSGGHLMSKSKSCLTCADISVKWYIVVIALLGLICALIGTIVGAVHSAGRDYISLALLLLGKLTTSAHDYY